MRDNLDRDERLCNRVDQVIDGSNRAYDLADRQAGTRVGRRAAEISKALADRIDVVNSEIRAGRDGI